MYGVAIDVKLDCCWSKKQAKRKIKLLKQRQRNFKRQARKVSGLDRGGLTFIQKGRTSLGYIWKAAYYQKKAAKMGRKIRKIQRCKRFPCFPGFRKKRKGGYGSVGALTIRQRMEDDANFAVSPLEIDHLMQPPLQGWGYVPDRHASKIYPWSTRLSQASDYLMQSIKKGNRLEVVRSLEDVSFWQGRVVCDVLGAEKNVQWKKLVPVFRKSQIAAAAARKFLG